MRKENSDANVIDDTNVTNDMNVINVTNVTNDTKIKSHPPTLRDRHTCITQHMQPHTYLIK